MLLRQSQRATINSESTYCLWPLFPHIPQFYPIQTYEVDCVKGSSDSVETSGIYDNVELVLFSSGLNASFRDAHYGSVAKVDEVNIGLVVDLEIVRL